MMVDRRQLITDLKSCVAEIIVLHEGKHWRIRATLAQGYLREKWAPIEDQTMLNIWDMDAQRFLDIKLEEITSVQAMYTP
jgi:hypothetical protein